MAAVLVDLVGVDRELVSRRDLPGETPLRAVDRLVVDPLLATDAGLLADEDVLSRGRDEGIGNRHVDAECTSRHEEPELVARDWAALRRFDVVDLVDFSDRAEAPALQIVGQVVALPLLRLKSRVHAAVEPVAAVL